MDYVGLTVAYLHNPQNMINHLRYHYLRKIRNNDLSIFDPTYLLYRRLIQGEIEPFMWYHIVVVGGGLSATLWCPTLWYYQGQATNDRHHVVCHHVVARDGILALSNIDDGYRLCHIVVRGRPLVSVEMWTFILGNCLTNFYKSAIVNLY